MFIMKLQWQKCQTTVAAIRLSNIDDLLSEQNHRNIKLCLGTQKIREDQLITESPRFVNNLKYNLKPELKQK